MADKSKVLYIEDDLASQLLVQRVLGFAGYVVYIAGRGLEGIDAAERERPDLILMDINLPDLSGREVTTRLRGDERFKHIPIVVLTAQKQIGEREKALASGATGYLTKPVDVDKLPGQVAHYLQGGKDTLDDQTLRNAQVAYSHEIVNRLETKIRELEESNAQLLRLDRMKDDFVQLTAHELRTPLTLVSGYSRLLQDSPAVRELKAQKSEIGMFVDGLADAIERMTRMINEILTISRIATDKIELSIMPTDMSDLVGTVIREFETATKKRNLHINFEAAQWPTHHLLDSDLIALCLRNLIGNAIKFTPDGGVIEVTGKTSANQLLIAVHDTGIGINRDDLQTIFDRFFTTNDTQLHSTSKTAYRGGGLGLGLAICRGVVEAHGGRIWAESQGRDEEKCPGSTFYMELPAQPFITSPHRKALA